MHVKLPFSCSMNDKRTETALKLNCTLTFRDLKDKKLFLNTFLKLKEQYHNFQVQGFFQTLPTKTSCTTPHYYPKYEIRSIEQKLWYYPFYQFCNSKYYTAIFLLRSELAKNLGLHLKGFEDFLPKLVEQFCYSKCYTAIFLLAELLENVDLSDNEDDDDANADDNDQEI